MANEKIFRYSFVFSKEGDMIYISHLDLLRLFHRAARRAGLPVALSQGFNPRMKIKLERALKLGVASASERGEMILKEVRQCRQIQGDWQKAMPEGIEIKEVTFLDSV
jgi:radical SAM-linked protein